MPLLVGGDDLLISSGYGTGSARLHLSRAPAGDWKAEEVWRTNTLKAKFTNLVHAGDFIYGLDDGVLTCIDARDGIRRWRDGSTGMARSFSSGHCSCSWPRTAMSPSSTHTLTSAAN